ncbi:MAG TPA: lipoyl domain-containing protein [Candidatus Dormibacteraeota bacterium]|jgi:pyruvate dehydrogenase E2 component (dihydrolipoamide acetyltransferase)|nr:lipoyl domain-containing protein [Candidatus Dormibacteraeota bacterium]
MAETQLVPVTVPRWGLTMEDGVVQEWMVGEGEEVREREVLVTIETDKAVGEVEAPVAGRVARILVPEGTAVRPGELLAEIETTA